MFLVFVNYLTHEARIIIFHLFLIIFLFCIVESFHSLLRLFFVLSFFCAFCLIIVIVSVTFFWPSYFLLCSCWFVFVETLVVAIV